MFLIPTWFLTPLGTARRNQLPLDADFKILAADSALSFEADAANETSRWNFLSKRPVRSLSESS